MVVLYFLHLPRYCAPWRWRRGQVSHFCRPPPTAFLVFLPVSVSLYFVNKLENKLKLTINIGKLQFEYKNTFLSLIITSGKSDNFFSYYYCLSCQLGILTQNQVGIYEGLLSFEHYLRSFEEIVVHHFFIFILKVANRL